MKALHRAVVGGGLGVLAMGAVASSVAFACTAQSPITAAGGATTVVATAGATVTVEAKGFAVDAPGSVVQYVDYGKPVFTWNDINGPVLAVAGEPTWVPTVTGGVNGARPVWIVDVQVPADASPRAESYGIIGTQTNAHGDLYVTGTLPVFVTGPAAPAPVAPIVAPVVVAPQPAPGVSSNPSSPGTPGTPTPQAAPTAPTATPAGARPANATSAGQPATASPSLASPSGAVGVPRATATASGPHTPGGSVDPTRPAPIPPSQELWSGLNATSAMSLLDAPAPTTSGSGFPTGAALLGTGLLAVAGAAILAGRRRLAIATAVRR